MHSTSDLISLPVGMYRKSCYTTSVLALVGALAKCLSFMLKFFNVMGFVRLTGLVELVACTIYYTDMWHLGCNS